MSPSNAAQECVALLSTMMQQVALQARTSGHTVQRHEMALAGKTQYLHTVQRRHTHLPVVGSFGANKRQPDRSRRYATNICNCWVTSASTCLYLRSAVTLKRSPKYSYATSFCNPLPEAALSHVFAMHDSCHRTVMICVPVLHMTHMLSSCDSHCR